MGFRAVPSRELLPVWVLISGISQHDGLDSRQMNSVPLPRVALFCFCMSALWPLVVADAGAATQIDQVYVVVNEEVVTQSEVARELRNAVYDLRSRGETVPPLSELQQRVVEQMVVQLIQYQRTQQLGMSLDEEELMDVIRDIAKRNNLSMLQLREEVQKSGRSYDEYRQELGRQVLVQRLIEQEITRHIRISEAEIDEYIEDIDIFSMMDGDKKKIDSLSPYRADPTFEVYRDIPADYPKKALFDEYDPNAETFQISA